MRKVKWGVLGTAGIARKQVIPSMQMAANCDLYGIAGKNKDKVDQFKQEYGFKHAYYSLQDMLADPEIEAVYIPLPNNLHKEWVLAAAAKGKHILCEKPLGANVAQVKEMFAACDDAGVHLMEAFAYLHSPLIIALKQIIDSGDLGKPLFIETTLLTSPHTAENIRERRDTLGGGIYDLGCYCISLIRTLLGEEPDTVRAVGNFTPAGVDDLVTAFLIFPSGAKASIVAGMCSPQRSEYFLVYCEQGIIDVPISYNECGNLEFNVIKADKTTRHSVETPNNYMLEVEQLGRCIRDGEKPLVSADFSIKNAQVIDQILAEIGYFTKYGPA